MVKTNSLWVFALTVLYSVSFSWGVDFRDNTWGDSPEDVQAKEGDGLVCTVRRPKWADYDYTGFIGYYPSNHLGVDGVVFFAFTYEEKLGRGGCLSCNNDILSFRQWEEGLSKSYGEPENCDDVLIVDDEFLARYYYGDDAAVEEGILNAYFALVRYWETENTCIWLVAEPCDDRLSVLVDYYSKDYLDYFRKENTRHGPRGGFKPRFDNDDQ